MDALTELSRAAFGVSDDHVVASRPDLSRAERTGIPEVILAETKALEDLIAIVEAFLSGRGRAILSRVKPEQVTALRERFADIVWEQYGRGRVLIARTDRWVQPVRGGRIGVLAAGTSDVPVAEEAAVVAREMGCTVATAYDVGVAGIHRLVEPMRAMRADGLDAVVVAAGMDGALPSVVAGLVGVPVIGLPVSVGYGVGGQGIGALMAMLQTCAPGLTVVNIDNGVGAGATAGLIARRAAMARGEIAPLG